MPRVRDVMNKKTLRPIQRIWELSAHYDPRIYAAHEPFLHSLFMGPPLEKFSYGIRILRTVRRERGRRLPLFVHPTFLSRSPRWLAGVSYVNANHSCIKARFARGG